MIHQAGGTTFLSCQTLVRKQILSRCPHFVWKQRDRLQSYARIVYSKHPWQTESEHKLDPDSQSENLFWWPSEGTKCILKFYQILLFEMKFSHFILNTSRDFAFTATLVFLSCPQLWVYCQWKRNPVHHISKILFVLCSRLFQPPFLPFEPPACRQ